MMKGKVFAVFAVVFAMILGGAFAATFEGGELNVTVNGKTNLSLVGEGAFGFDTTYFDNNVILMADNAGTIYGMISRDNKDGSGTATDLTPPTFKFNDTLLMDNATRLSDFGFDCDAAGNYCPANYSEMTDLVLDPGIGGSALNIMGNLVLQNLTGTLGGKAINTWYIVNWNQATPFTLNESVSSSFDLPLFAPLRFYKNPAQDLAAVVIDFLPDTPAYILSNQSYAFQRIRFNKDSDGTQVARTASGNPTYKALTLYNSTTPILYFNYPLSQVNNASEAYTVSSVLQYSMDSPYPMGGNFPLGYWATTGLNQRGATNGDTGYAPNDPFTTAEYVETSCDLQNYYPLQNGTCILFGSPPPAPPTGMFLLLNGGFIQAVAGIAMAMVAMFVMIAYTKGKDGTKDVNDAFEFFGRWGEK
jgi:hypothetical protein